MHAENTFAVIIGNENYQGAINVPFAENDAKTFAAYCEKTLGLPQRNIKVYTNANYGTMVNAISKIKDIATVAGSEEKNETDKGRKKLDLI